MQRPILKMTTLFFFLDGWIERPDQLIAVEQQTQRQRWNQSFLLWRVHPSSEKTFTK
jgi:hypothetical protein